MMLVKDLLYPCKDVNPSGPPPGVDPLREEHALQEAQLLDIRFDAMSLTVGLLLEMRMALQLRETNTAVLFGGGVRSLSWVGPGRDTDLTAWTLGGSMPRLVDGMFHLEFGMFPDGARFVLVAESAAFFGVDVPGLVETPPNYTGFDRAGLGALVASWDSPCKLVNAVHVSSGVSD